MDFIELTAREAKDLQAALNYADANGGIRKLRVSVNTLTNDVKFKVNEGTWSPPMGTKGEPY